MIAVPSMLIVAPSGITNEAMELLTPKRFSTVLSTTGIEALLLAVLKANNIAGCNFLKKVIGFKRA